MKKDIVEVLDSQTAKTQSEPTAVSKEPENIVLEEVAHTCKNKCDSCEFDYKERSSI